MEKQNNYGRARSEQHTNAPDKVNKVDESSFLFLVGGKEKKGWIVDSGATRHVVHDKEFFTEIDETYRSSIELANGQAIGVNGIGKGTLNFLGEDGCVRNAVATEVLYAPKLVGNVLSVRRLVKSGFKIEFDDRYCRIIRDGRPIGIADIKGELYILREPDTVCNVLAHNDDCIHGLHRKMGHRDPTAIRKMASMGMIDGLRIVECGIKESCDICMKGKMTRLPFPQKSSSQSKAALDLVHTDVCGPMRTETPSGKRYFVTYIDDYSGFTFVHLLKHKSEVVNTMKQFIALCENKFGRKPTTIRSDRGGEYTGGEFTDLMKSHGIQIQLTAAYSPQQNGRAERKNRTLVEMARCMLLDADLPYTFWGEAISTANFIQNRMLTRSTDTTPYERWNGGKPVMNNFHIFGSKCFVHIPSEKRGKLEDVAVEMIFLGHDTNSKAYRCYDRATKKLVISRDVRFSKTQALDNEVTVNLNPVEQKPHIIPVTDEKLSIEEEEQNVLNNEANDDEHFVDALEDNHDVEEEKVKNETQQNDQRVSARSNKGIPPKRLIEEMFITKEVTEKGTLVSCDAGGD